MKATNGYEFRVSPIDILGVLMGIYQTGDLLVLQDYVVNWSSDLTEKSLIKCEVLSVIDNRIKVKTHDGVELEVTQDDITDRYDDHKYGHWLK